MWEAVDDECTYIVSVFDDGNERYSHHHNAWRVSGTWRGKSRVVNVEEPGVCIGSISTWKLRLA